MSSSLSNSQKSSSRISANSDTVGITYEKLMFALLAERGYELSICDNSQFQNFGIGKEIGFGGDSKFDDIVIWYDDQDNKRNITSVQIKHKQNKSPLNFLVLFGSRSGNMGKDFNLRKYFRSYLNIREKLETTKSKELKNGQINYVAIYTNACMDKTDLQKNGITLNEAPLDIRTLFALRNSSLGKQEARNCYQIGIGENVWDTVSSMFKKCSDLHRIAKELAQYLVSEKDNIIGTDEAPLKYYHVALGKEVIEHVNEQPCMVKFRKDFLDNCEIGSKKELLDKIFEAIRELDTHKRENSDDELKQFLREAQLKVVSHFGDYLPKEHSSEMFKIAKMFAEYILAETKKDIIGRKGSAITHYEFAFQEEVIKISDEVQHYSFSENRNIKRESYCVAKFRNEFINSELGLKKVLKKAIFDAIRKSDESKANANDDELKNLLRNVELKVDQNFGKIQNFKLELPDEWSTIKDDDIKHFFKCFVLFVNQPNAADLLTEIYPAQDTFLKGTSVGDVIHKLHQKFKDRLEKSLGIHNRNSNEDMWLYGDQIMQYVRELQDAVYTCVMTLRYEEKVMQYGWFTSFEQQLIEDLNNFLFRGKRKILCICTINTLFTAVKVIQFLTKKDYGMKYGQIFIEAEDLNYDRVKNAFQSESNKLLIIQFKHVVNRTVKEFYKRFFEIIVGSPDKQIILIVQKTSIQEFSRELKNVCMGQCDFNEIYAQCNDDDINLKNFELKENPLRKESIVFQEQEQNISISELTGIASWNSYIDYLSVKIFLNEHDIIDIMASILIEDKIEVGSKPSGTSNLDGAYASMFEEVNAQTLANKLLPMELDNTEDVYIMCGISKENFGKLIQYLGLASEEEKIKNQLGECGSESRIQIADDQFTDESFKSICCNRAYKRIFWIDVKDIENEPRFILQQFYNPTFYLQRAFKQVSFHNELIEEIVQASLSEIYIFYSTNSQQEILDHFSLSSDQAQQVQKHFENGKIYFFSEESGAKATFKTLCKRNEVVHLLKFHDKKIIWYNSNHSINNLRKYVHKDASELPLTEDDLIKQIKDRRILIIAGDPGMGKTTTLTKLYESKDELISFIETNWVIKINLKDHIKAIKNIKPTKSENYITSVINFLSRLDVKLSNKLAKCLLKIALDKNMNFSRPLLLVFDGFDEVLDAEDRKKIIELLQFLKEETPTKLWITTRLHYKPTLEDALSTFAMKFIPFNNEVTKVYVEKYLKDRLYLILSEEIFSEIFHNKVETNKNIQKYTKEFLNKMESVFKNNVFEFVGMPLQLHLMLEASTNHFKTWVENSDKDLNFNYLGQDLWEIYEKFIDKKYDIYFQKVCTIEHVKQRFDRNNVDNYLEGLAISLIRDEEIEESLIDFKDMVLTTGIIKSHDSNFEFIHATFRDYFAAKQCVKWIVKVSKKVSESTNQKYVLEEILMKPDYQIIRKFINLNLKRIPENELHKSFNQYEKIAENLLLQVQSPLIADEGSLLHIAFEENNTRIAWFLLKCLKECKTALKKILFRCDEWGNTPLHLACVENDYEAFIVLLDAVKEISEDTLQEFLRISNKDTYNALDMTLFSNNIQFCKELLKRTNNKFDLIMNENQQDNSLCLACEHGREDFFMTLRQELDDNSLKQLLSFECASHSALYKSIKQFAADVYSNNIVKLLLSTAESIKDNNETLKKLLLPSDCSEVEYFPLIAAIEKGKIDAFNIILNTAKSINDNNETLKKMLLPENNCCLPLNCAVENGDFDVVKIILSTAKHIDDDNYTLKKLLYNNSLTIKKNPAVIAAEKAHYKILELLLEVAASVDNETFQKLICAVIKNGENKIQINLENSCEEIWVDSFKIFVEDKHKSVREKIMKIYHSTPLTDKFAYKKRVLISAIACKKIAKVKNILDNAKSSGVKELEILLLAVDKDGYNTLHVACDHSHLQIIKELISYALSINDKGKTLENLLTGLNKYNETPFETTPFFRYTDAVKQMIESFISETEDENVAHFLQEINMKYAECDDPPSLHDDPPDLDSILCFMARKAERTFLKEDNPCIIV